MAWFCHLDNLFHHRHTVISNPWPQFALCQYWEAESERNVASRIVSIWEMESKRAMEELTSFSMTRTHRTDLTLIATIEAAGGITIPCYCQMKVVIGVYHISYRVPG